MPTIRRRPREMKPMEDPVYAMDFGNDVVTLKAQVNNRFLDGGSGGPHQIVLYRMSAKKYMELLKAPKKSRSFFDFTRAQTFELGDGGYRSIESPALDPDGISTRRKLKFAIHAIGFNTGGRIFLLDDDERNLMPDNFRVTDATKFPARYFVDRPRGKRVDGVVVRDGAHEPAREERTHTRVEATRRIPEEKVIRIFSTREKAEDHADSLELAGLNVRVDEEIVTTYQVVVKSA